MHTDMMPGCCGLKIIRTLRCLGKIDEFSKKEAETFDALVNTGKAGYGNWATYGCAKDTIAVITDSNRYNKPEEYQRQKKFFEDKKWTLLATWKSYESGGTNYMYGSPGITRSK